MDDLKKLQENLKLELNEKEELDQEIDDMTVDSEEDEMDDEKESKSNNSRIRINTTTKITGIIRRLEFEINYADLAKKISDEISGLVLTRAKAKQLFKLIRTMMGF